MLKVQSLNYQVKNRKILHDVTLSFSKGFLYGILGPNGSGKSTLLKTMTGIWTPNTGTVHWHENNLLREDRRTISKTVTLVPQNSHLPFDFTVSDMVAMGRYPQGLYMKKSVPSEDLAKVLQSVDVCHLQDRKISEISHGERQRVYIARALMTESPVLLLDEPTANLDVCHQLAIWKLLRSLLQQDKIIIVASHDLTAIERYSDQIAVLHQGKCIATGEYSAVVTPEILRNVFGLDV